MVSMICWRKVLQTSPRTRGKETIWQAHIIFRCSQHVSLLPSSKKIRERDIQLYHTLIQFVKQTHRDLWPVSSRVATNVSVTSVKNWKNFQEMKLTQNFHLLHSESFILRYILVSQFRPGEKQVPKNVVVRHYHFSIFIFISESILWRKKVGVDVTTTPFTGERRTNLKPTQEWLTWI